jgi:spermidine/putrescine transport system substrate-binding protein
VTAAPTRRTTALVAPLVALIALLTLASLPTVAAAQGTLRIITWADYVPADVAAQFTKETGIKVEVTLSNNEEMISKLRATRGAGFDIAQPSQDRILGPQQEFGIYKPIDPPR